MKPAHKNHAALIQAAHPNEERVRLEISTINGLFYIPSSKTFIPFYLVPSHITGLCNATFFDKHGRETRKNVSLRLPGPGDAGTQADAPVQATAATSSQIDRESAAELSESEESDEAEDSLAGDDEADAAVEDEVEPEDEFESDTVKMTVLDREERLLSDLTVARQTQIRTAVSAHEEVTGMQIEAEKLRILRGHSYTREIGENHQLMTMMRRDIAAMLATMREVGRSQVVSSEAAGNAMLRMANKVAKRLRDPAFALLSPPPPPPPDYAGIAIALLNTVGRIGSAWAPGRKRSTSKKQALLRLLTEAQGPIAAGDPDGLKDLLETFSKVEAKSGEKTDAKSAAASDGKATKPQLPQASTLAELIDSGQLRELLESGKLKQLIDSGQLEAILNALSGDK